MAAVAERAAAGEGSSDWLCGRRSQASPFSPDGRLVLTSSFGNTVNPSPRLSGHTGSVAAVAFSPDGRLALTGSSDNTARLWEVASGRPLASLSHTAPVTAVAFSPDGQLVLTGSAERTARLWEVASALTN